MMGAIERAWDWEVGPCVDRLGHIASWDINIRPEPGARGVAVIASVYSGEAVARAILAACQATTEHPLARMTRLDEEMGLYDNEQIPLSPNLTGAQPSVGQRTVTQSTAEPLPIDEGLVERVARAIDDVTRATIERDIPTHQRGQVVADSRALARAAIEVMLGEK